MTDPGSLFIVQIISALVFSKEDTKMHCRGERFFALTSSKPFVTGACGECGRTMLFVVQIIFSSLVAAIS